ncbi:MAG: hypothetical protein RL466_156 [Actinomycetota bacterium]
MVSKRSRDLAPDVLRGFALFGILVVNIPFMALSSENGARGEYVQGALNGSVALVMLALFAGKFYLLFSFLFGYSSSYIIQNERKNRARWIRRCFALMAFGALHFTFLWHGDILFFYGILGIVLIAFLFRTDRTLQIWTRIIYATSCFILVALGSLIYIGERYFPEESNASLPDSGLDEVLRNSTFLESIAPRVNLWVWGSLGAGLLLQGGFAFAAFLYGLRAQRTGLLSAPFDLPRASKMIKTGLILGLPIQLLLATFAIRNEQSADVSEAIHLITLFLAFMAAPLHSMAYVGAILKCIENRPHLVSWMAPAGKMSLTVYIGESIFASLIFGPWGLGLFQELEIWAVALVAIGIWLSLVWFSTLWLKRFRQGPLEWLMHLLTRSRRASSIND